MSVGELESASVRDTVRTRGRLAEVLLVLVRSGSFLTFAMHVEHFRSSPRTGGFR